MNRSLRWDKIDRCNLPDGIVLACNDIGEFLVGWLDWDEEADNVSCDDDGTQMNNCTYFIDLEDVNPNEYIPIKR